MGRILASNPHFVAVSIGRQITVFKMDDLKNVIYDGTATGFDRFAPGNQLAIKQMAEGLSTVVSEERPEVQTDEKKNNVRDRGLDR